MRSTVVVRRTFAGTCPWNRMPLGRHLGISDNRRCSLLGELNTVCSQLSVRLSHKLSPCFLQPRQRQILRETTGASRVSVDGNHSLRSRLPRGSAPWTPPSAIPQEHAFAMLKPRTSNGRPALAASTRRSEVVSLRLTPGELASLQADASIEGALVADLVRARALGKTAQVRQTIPTLNREAWSELSRTAANLNQLAAYLNGALASGPDAETTLSELASAVAEVRRALIGAS